MVDWVADASDFCNGGGRCGCGEREGCGQEEEEEGKEDGGEHSGGWGWDRMRGWMLEWWVYI